jgi:hypothetical protein
LAVDAQVVDLLGVERVSVHGTISKTPTAAATVVSLDAFALVVVTVAAAGCAAV